MNAIVHTLTFIMSLIAQSAVTGGPEKTSTEDDLARLQGRWTARAGARHEVRVVLDIKGYKATAAVKTPHGARLFLTGEVKLDETASPRRLDWVKFTGADQQEFPPLLGIYALTGDRFTVCNGGLNRPRPSEFKPGNGILAEVVIFEREPSLANSKPSATAKSSATIKQ